MINNKFLFSLLLFAMFIPFVSASVTTTLYTPADNYYSQSGTVSVLANVQGSASSYICQLWDKSSGTWASTIARSTTNNTNVTISKSFSDTSVGFIWNVKCYDATNSSDYAFGSANRTLNIDTVNPSVTIVNYADNYWLNSNTVSLSARVIDSNPAYCALYLSNISGVGIALNNSNATYINNSVIVFTNTLSDGDSWKYYWYCNDSSGRSTTTSTYTLKTDATAPTGVALGVKFANNTKTTSHIPTINWSIAVDTNFNRYEIKFDNDSDLLSPEYSANETNISIVEHTVLTRLTKNSLYHFSVYGFDNAGNSVGFKARYTAKEPCYILYSGWNGCGLVNDEVQNLSKIASDSGASIVSWYNATGQAWVSYVSGISTNAGINLNRGDGVWLYTGSQVYWDNNRIWSTNATLIPTRFVNNSVSGWNYFGIQNDNDTKIFQTLNDKLGSNIAMYSFYNNSKAKYTPFFWNVSINNVTGFNSGYAIWAYSVNSSQIWNGAW